MKNTVIRIAAALLIAACSILPTVAAQFSISRGEKITISISGRQGRVVGTAVDMLASDLHAVTGAELVRTSSKKAKIAVRIDPGTVTSPQGFRIEALTDGRLSVKAHDSHGAAYGILELSRLMGVSPWVWWADAAPEPKDTFTLTEGFVSEQAPSVEFRGIFINDEDWGLMPWSSATNEPELPQGEIGPKTNSRIFELLLRLRANTFWPAMHECTVPFFLTKGNREAAEKYGIFIGTSHCEPMACNAAGEWSRRGKGDYDYVNNSREVYRFWEERVKDVAQQEIIYTICMRGVHDGAMNGADGTEQQKKVLEKVIDDQRGMLAKHVCKDISKVPQVFIPYKEVLDIYNAGLNIPDDVTLMWCDDNYGYIRHLPTEAERSRAGGNGIYYHVSYWGRPHDYLWLGTFSPGLLFTEMKKAYDSGIKRIWILNVGDLKPAEYQTELFMDMAWDMDSVCRRGVRAHAGDFLSREFGDEAAERLLPLMEEHYRLAFIRKPEFMGNTREEEWNDPSARYIRDLPWSDNAVKERLDRYKAISDRSDSIATLIPSRLQTSYYHLVEYPVKAAYQMNRKLLAAQLARHGKCNPEESSAAYDSIVALTDAYNQGKWAGLMDHRPRRLPVFDRSPHALTLNSGDADCHAFLFEGTEAEGSFTVCDMLGTSGKAALLNSGSPVSFYLPHRPGEKVDIEVRVLPTHPADTSGVAVEISLGDSAPVRLDFATKGRSEEWKENVLRNYASRTVSMCTDGGEARRICIKALSAGVILDRVLVREKTSGKRICVFGDSYVRNHRCPFAETWHAKAAARLGMEYVNRGINGNAIAFDRTDRGFGIEMARRYAELPDSADVIMIIAGHNDAVFIGDSKEKHDTFRDGLETLCSGLRERYPDAAIAFVLPWSVDRAGFAEVIADIRLACTRHGFALFDAESAGGIKVNDDSFRDRYFQDRGVNDTAHLNSDGHDLIVAAGTDFLRSLVK
ncbi:MAG: glycosyl hydrolase 115 family protein [Muribaculaceae bacterium]|nr:glycosyl hydrolase 115 family protein [Muribaculaceae bacterium]